MDSLKFPGRNNKKGWTLDELCVKQFGCSRKTALDSVILVAVYMFYKPIDSKLRAGFQLASICASRRWIQLESSWPANNVTFGKTFKVDSHQRERDNSLCFHDTC